ARLLDRQFDRDRPPAGARTVSALVCRRGGRGREDRRLAGRPRRCACGPAPADHRTTRRPGPRHLPQIDAELTSLSRRRVLASERACARTRPAPERAEGTPLPTGQRTIARPWTDKQKAGAREWGTGLLDCAASAADGSEDPAGSGELVARVPLLPVGDVDVLRGIRRVDHLAVADVHADVVDGPRR